ncbi:hypothetical protein SERLADRAFT_443871 [Serpula lacrymans var. lacrymans S7.9]|uniref:Uncharacterized protein n=1 Tax=Serpula lacrymans var. lacrymans (strain S7.9) TaxID=578457 RepID=F8PDT3_SERL9|nr:uncharacterized protein SERLADRAFT_443871 [Serpula lacrymans var. lacrymans S7.9]EGO18530.1 hypothetical protein SERLADRAFT_443871 [Serpula lacrymans var. lacrymans S7.9]
MSQTRSQRAYQKLLVYLKPSVTRLAHFKRNKNCENGEREAVKVFLCLGGQTVCNNARNILAQQGYLTSPPSDLLSLPAITGHTFPGRHPPHLPSLPPPVSCPSLPDLVLPMPTPPSPAPSSITDVDDENCC